MPQSHDIGYRKRVIHADQQRFAQEKRKRKKRGMRANKFRPPYVPPVESYTPPAPLAFSSYPWK